MGANSASGRGPARIRRGPAKVIQLPSARRRRYRRAAALLVVAIGVATAGAALVWLYVVPLIQLAPDLAAGMSAQELEILRLVNDERERDGEKPLKASPRLVVASRGHSYDMALRHYLSHDSPAGDTPAVRLQSVGVNYTELGENVYMERNVEARELPERAVEGWLNSPEHRANLLSPKFSATGIGVARSADGATYVTQDFVD
jgi:uncharacterized protein YkwD